MLQSLCDLTFQLFVANPKVLMGFRPSTCRPAAVVDEVLIGLAEHHEVLLQHVVGIEPFIDANDQILFGVVQ